MMTSYERVKNILNHQPVDRIAVYEQFWGETYKVWTKNGSVRVDEDFGDHFNFDLELCGVFNMVADIHFEPEVLEDDGRNVTTKDGNYAILKRRKDGYGTPEHVDFDVKCREDWERMIKPQLVATPERINFDVYRQMKEKCKRANKFFFWAGINVFELMHPMCGHIQMLMSMIDDPDWVKDMVETYSDLLVGLQKILFQQEGYPDGIWYFEDMGYKGAPFMSPQMYREFIMPGHIKTIGYAHEHNLPVVMHSCGFVEPLLPHMIEAGIDALQAMEVKAGMDLLRIHKQYGKQIVLIGGIDVRAITSNDLSVIDQELESKIPFVKEGYGYILHSDHSIPETVEHDTLHYFIKRGLELGAYE